MSGSRARTGALLLLLPPLGAIGYRFVAEIGSATPAMLTTIAVVVAVNAPLGELLGRGVFTIHPGKLNPAMFVASSLVLGLCWGMGRVAERTDHDCGTRSPSCPADQRRYLS